MGLSEKNYVIFMKKPRNKMWNNVRNINPEKNMKVSRCLRKSNKQ